MSMQIKSIDIIRRTNVLIDNPNGLAGQNDLGTNSGKTLAVTEEVYDFTNKNDRQDILSKIAADVYKNTGYDKDALRRLVTEMTDVIAALEDDLPFT